MTKLDGFGVSLSDAGGGRGGPKKKRHLSGSVFINQWPGGHPPALPQRHKTAKNKKRSSQHFINPSLGCPEYPAANRHFVRRPAHPLPLSSPTKKKKKKTDPVSGNKTPFGFGKGESSELWVALLTRQNRKGEKKMEFMSRLQIIWKNKPT